MRRSFCGHVLEFDVEAARFMGNGSSCGGRRGGRRLPMIAGPLDHGNEGVIHAGFGSTPAWGLFIRLYKAESSGMNDGNYSIGGFHGKHFTG